MIVTLTGHRPEKLPDIPRLEHWTKFYLGASRADAVITGMAAGFDLIGGKITLDLGIPLICAKPWTTHKARKGDEELYAELIDRAEEVYVVTESDSYPGPWVYQKRNEWMVDEGDKGLACWDGSSGGTKNCLSYFKKVGKTVVIINPSNFNIRIQLGTPITVEV